MNGSNGTRQIAGMGNPSYEVSIGRALENPWFLITHNEILAIQERLHHIEAELPETSLRQIGEICCILHEVRDRQQ
jgi:hypothetical protein